jgi:twitching motility two-component system response regulator PilG
MSTVMQGFHFTPFSPIFPFMKSKVYYIERRKGATGMSKLVMIIDDSATVRKIVEVSLKREGIPYISYANGVEAIRALSEQEHLVPDLVFLDIALPRIDGYKIAQYLKSHHQFDNTVIVMLSGHNGILDRLKGRLSGARDYLTKPFRTQDILSVVHEYLGITPLKHSQHMP